jgi:hypothetical protein
MVASVLKDFGSPEKVAASYLPERYLVGPQLYPTYTLVLRIVLTVILVVALVGLGVDVAQRGHTLADFIETVTQVFAGLMSSIFQALGTVTFIFAIIQWAQPNFKEKSKSWDPRQLKDSQPGDHVSIPGQIVEIALTAIVVLLFNFYPDVIGLYSMVDGQWVGVPVLSEAFFRYMPWLNVVWGASILLNLLLINSGRWTKMTRWLSVGTGILTVVVMLSLIFGPDLLALDSQAFTRLGWADASLQDLAKVFNGLARFVLGIIVFFQIVELAQTLWRMLGKGKELPFIGAGE